MKKILGFLAAFAALFLFVTPSYASEHGGTINRISGYVFSLGSPTADTTTYDVWDIGFKARWVRLCGEPSPSVERAYIRLANSVTTTVDGSSPTVAPVSSSSAFITTVSGEVQIRALPFSLPVSPGATVAIEGVRCETNPWRTRGLVIHNVSGTATIDAWAW
ncbi:hypothetical protein LCGC14_1552870 [marine sediment metagenome]|uniref:Uncharacterized protein n=1 Tax=marine sediment metagenome TaxID=412755 RepID=A0A0F9IPS0_9ZZZZ